MKIKTLQQFEAFLQTRIPTREALFMGDIGLQRAKFFMRQLGNPQNKIKVIHIAGTSGKGSTAYLTSHLLQSQGFKVGLSISPHVFDIRERTQIDSKLPNEKLILKYFNEILPVIKKMEKCKYGSPTFFEINVALAFYMFQKEKVDYAVMETGLGGTLDATNTVTSKNKICILTKIGLDHTEILGKTISKIAQQKAGIIQDANIVISHQSSVIAKSIVKKTCEKKQSPLFNIDKKNYKIISSTTAETVFNFSFVIPAKTEIQPQMELSARNNKISEINTDWIPNQFWNGTRNALVLENVSLGLIGLHQAENCSLALACLEILSKRDDFNIDEQLLRSVLRNISIPGRMEILKIKNQTIIIDGAHNPQKMEVFTNSLQSIFPNQKFTFLVAFKKGKDFEKMLKYIIPLADKILLAEFYTSLMDNHLSSTDNVTISKFLQKQNFQNFEIIKNGHSGFPCLGGRRVQNVRMLSSKNGQRKKPIVITGSLYFIGSIYPFLKK